MIKPDIVVDVQAELKSLDDSKDYDKFGRYVSFFKRLELSERALVSEDKVDVSGYPDYVKHNGTSKLFKSGNSQMILDNSDKYFATNIQVLDKSLFEIPGLGESGVDCMCEKGFGLLSDGSGILYKHLHCKRVQCPKCWKDWAVNRVFDMVMRIWSYSLYYSKKPFFVVCSVPPDKVNNESWTWSDVDTSLFRRGYRRLNAVGVDGGYAFFHPFRIPDNIKDGLRDAGYGKKGLGMDAGLWRGVRADALGLGDWRFYVNWSPHLHGIVFGYPESHSCKDFVIRFKEKSKGVPKPMLLEDVIGYARYLISHCGVCNHTETRATRSFGVLSSRGKNKFDARKLLGVDRYNRLASLVASKLNMVWDADNEELCYPLKVKVSEDKAVKILPIWNIFELLKDKVWVSRLSPSQLSFWESLAELLYLNKSVDPDMLFHPEDIRVIGEIIPEVSDYG